MTDERSKESAPPSLDGYFFGGYFVTVRTPRPVWEALAALPDTFVSACGCMTEIFPDAWAYEWVQYSKKRRTEEAAKIGIPESAVPEAVGLVTALEHQGVIGWLHCIRDLDAARELWGLHHESSGWLLLGLALRSEDAPTFLEVCAPHAHTARWGIYDEISKGKPVPGGGIVLGFEVLDFEESGLEHSWLCNGFPDECREKFSVLPNQHGLIPSIEQAKVCTEYITRDGSGAEPGLWQPWMLLDFTSQMAEETDLPVGGGNV